MKTLIIGAGPLGSLYACRMHQAGHDVTLLARGNHYVHIKNHGVALVDAFSGERTVTRVPVVRTINPTDEYDLVIVLMRKNSVLQILPMLGRCRGVGCFLFMGNNVAGFREYLRYISWEKLMFGFPGGGGARVGHDAHYVDSETPGGKPLSVTLGELNGTRSPRLRAVRKMFLQAGVPVRCVGDIDSWLKYHAAFILPLAGALLQAGDNHALAVDSDSITQYIRAVREGAKTLRVLGYTRSYNIKLRCIEFLPESLSRSILQRVFRTRFAEVAMMMHVRVARDEMQELEKEFTAMQRQAVLRTPNLDALNMNLVPDHGGQR